MASRSRSPVRRSQNSSPSGRRPSRNRSISPTPSPQRSSFRRQNPIRPRQRSPSTPRRRSPSISPTPSPQRSSSQSPSGSSMSSSSQSPSSSSMSSSSQSPSSSSMSSSSQSPSPRRYYSRSPTPPTRQIKRVRHGLDNNLLDNDHSSSKELDRISQLPDCIIQQILSFLPTRDAVKTGVLAKRWSYLWTTTPCLCFWQIDMEGRFWGSSYFIDFIYRTLMLHRRMNVEKFTLSFSGQYGFNLDYRKINVMIRSMTLANVKELNLDFGREIYKLPLHLYSNTCLTKLYLSGCAIKPAGSISWDSLKILSIGGAPLDDDLMKNVIEGCPSMEFLELYKFHGLNKLSLTNRNLIKVVIKDHRYCERDDSTFDISAPYLQSLVMSGDMWMYNYRVLNAKSLVDCSLDFTFHAWKTVRRYLEECKEDMLLHLLEDLCHVKELTLGAWFIPVLSKMELKGMSCSMPECRYLAIDTRLKNWGLPGIAYLLQNSPSLETLIINFITATSMPQVRFDKNGQSMPDAENYWMSQTRNFKCLASYLKTVKITGVVPWNFGEFVVPLIHFLVTNARVLENITVRAGEDGTWKELFQMAQRLLSLPRSSPCSVLKFLEY